MGLEPTHPKDTWPSTMPVYQFQHPGGYLTLKTFTFLTDCEFEPTISNSIFVPQIYTNMAGIIKMFVNKFRFIPSCENGNFGNK